MKFRLMNMTCRLHLLFAVFLFSSLSLAGSTGKISPANGSLDSIDRIMADSKTNPNKVYVLILSATWCGFCKKFKEGLSTVADDEKTAMSRADWTELETDLQDEKKLLSVFQKYGLPTGNGLPYSIVVKNGQMVGDMNGLMEPVKVEEFLKMTESYASPTKNSSVQSIPKFPCGPKLEEGSACAVGISGLGKPDGFDGTENFGRANLLTFKGLFDSKAFVHLFAPSMHDVQVAGEKVGNGQARLFVKNPLASYQNDFSDGGGKNNHGAFYNLWGMGYDGEGSKDLRVMVTGHGGVFGVDIPGDALTDSSYLDAPALKKILSFHKKEGKNIRALMLQCYGGQFGDSFMPSDDDVGVSCGAFATLPEKTSSGCYSSDYSGDRQDYLAQAAKFKRCDGSQNARELHYKVAEESESHDIPMLTSEYFLLYGEVEKLLAPEKAFAPPWGIVRRDFGNGLVLYFDNVNQVPLKALYKGKRIKLPQLLARLDLGLTDSPGKKLSAKEVEEFKKNSQAWCKESFFKGPIRTFPSFQYLRQKFSGTFPSYTFPQPCLPVYKISWSEPKEFSGKQMVFKTHDSAYDTFPTCLNAGRGAKDALSYCKGFKNELTEEEMNIPISDLKPGAKALVGVVLPEVLGTGGYTEDYDQIDMIEEVIRRTEGFDKARAETMKVLLKKSLEVSHFQNLSIFRIAFMDSLFGNHAPVDIDGKTAALSRLAHLASASVMEYKLRDLARTNGQARKLVKKLDRLKSCENDLM